MKQPIWHSIEYKKDGIEAVAFAASSSPWFDGHFQGNPVLPGIALIAMVFDAVQHHEAKRGNQIKLKALKRVRFKKPIVPDKLFVISVAAKGEELETTYIFKLTVNDERVCSGIITVELCKAELCNKAIT